MTQAYKDWPNDAHVRWIRAGHMFGKHLMHAARDYAVARIPEDAPPVERQARIAGAMDAIYGVMMLLDGVADADIDEAHRAEYVLTMRIIAERKPIEELELAPGGDGLCIGYHYWKNDEYE